MNRKKGEEKEERKRMEKGRKKSVTCHISVLFWTPFPGLPGNRRTSG